jgi:putative phage-type endonuclease
MIEQRSKEWFKQRRGRVTASLVGAILGNAPYLSRDEAMRRMVRDYHGAPSEFEGNAATTWGVTMEVGAVTDFTLETGLSVRAAHFVEFENWAGASPDGHVESGGIIEIKCPYSLRQKPDPEFKSPLQQPHYYDQMQFQMMCTGEKKCYFYQWAPGGTMLHVIEANEDWVHESVPILKAFYREYLEELHNPEHLEEKRVLIDTDEAKNLMDQYEEVNESIERAQEKKSELLERLVDLAKGRNAIIAGRKLSRVKREGSISYAKAVKELAPDADLSKWKGKDSEYWRIF